MEKKIKSLEEDTLVLSWMVKDEYGARRVELWHSSEGLSLIAFDRDYQEVPHHLFENKKLISFEEYLEEEWWKDGHIKDEFPDGFNDWLCDFSADDWIDYAEEWKQTREE